MKNIIRLLSVSLCAGVFAFASCSGVDGDEDENLGTGEYVFKADKTVIEADGKDEAKFYLQDPDGAVIEKYLEIRNETTGEKLDSRTFSSVRNGEWTFSLAYKGKPVDGTVTITAKNREKYEKYLHKVVVYDVTDVMCGPCGVLAGAFENVDANLKENLLVMAIHGRFSNSDPWTLGDVYDRLQTAFDCRGTYPCTIFDLALAKTGSLPASDIEKQILNQLGTSPATCGISFSSVITSSTDKVITVGELEKEVTEMTVAVDATLESSTGGTYDLVYAIMLDDQRFAGGTVLSGRYNDIVIAMTGNYMKLGGNAFTVGAGQSHQASSPAADPLTITFLKSEAEAQRENCRVAVLALRKLEDGSAIIDNAAVCKLGESAELVLN